MATSEQPAGRAFDGRRAYPPPGRVESIWPAQATVLVAIALQLLLPDRLTVGPRWLIPGLEAALLVGFALATPRELEHEHTRRRRMALGLTGLVSAANILSLVLLSHELLKHGISNGHELIVAGALIWLTNILIFGLWYWEADRGGPGSAPPDRMSRRTFCSHR